MGNACTGKSTVATAHGPQANPGGAARLKNSPAATAAPAAKASPKAAPAGTAAAKAAPGKITTGIAAGLVSPGSQSQTPASGPNLLNATATATTGPASAPLP